jgi:hypothetical protein
MDNRPLSRRELLQILSLGAAAACSLQAGAAPAERLDAKDPQALSLGYVEDAARVDSKKYPSYVKGSKCENCLQLQGKDGERFRPCATFQGRLVPVSGWCSAWAAEI